MEEEHTLKGIATSHYKYRRLYDTIRKLEVCKKSSEKWSAANSGRKCKR